MDRCYPAPGVCDDTHQKILFKRGLSLLQGIFLRLSRYSKTGWQMANTVPFHTIRIYKKGLERNNTSAEYNLGAT